MKLNFANRNRAFSRTQLLMIVCLALLAFEFGTRYAETQHASKTKPKPTNAIPTNLILTAVEPIEEVETNEPPQQTSSAPPLIRYAAPATNAARPRPAQSGSQGQPQIIKADSRKYNQKIPPPPTNSPVYGIRIAVP